MSASTLTITETKPTSLIKDFNTFIRYLAAHPINLTKTNEYISRKGLYELNQLMSNPNKDVSPRTDQPSYPILHLFYHLTLSGKLFLKVPGKGGVFLKPTERLTMYEELKPTEQYFFLLETLWTDADWEKLQAATYGREPLPYLVSEFLGYLGEQKPGKKIEVRNNRSAVFQMLWGWEYFLLYFSFFGFFEATRYEDEDYPKRSFQAQSITPSAFGITIAPILSEARKLTYWNLPYRRKYFGEWNIIPSTPLPEGIPEFLEAELGSNRPKKGVKINEGKPGDPFFLPFVSLFAEGELEKTLPREEIKFVDGTYVFKVALAKDLWRRIEISAEDTLFHLHKAIQDAYDFDDDHLYSFFMDGKAWSQERFTSPYDDEGPHVDEVRIGELGLYVGKSILYLFDYGDEWRFQVELEEIRKEGRKPQEPRILEEKGEAPQQYYIDDDWY